MDSQKYHQYRDSASMLWLAGALLVAVALALFLQAGRRETLFYIVFIVGSVVLVRLNQRRDTAARQEKAAALPSPDLVAELLASEKLSPEAARDWLDRLLVAQQQEEQK